MTTKLSNHEFSLKNLADPEKFQAALDINCMPVENLRTYLSAMQQIRLAEQQLAAGRRNGLIGRQHSREGLPAVGTEVIIRNCELLTREK